MRRVIVGTLGMLGIIALVLIALNVSFITGELPSVGRAVNEPVVVPVSTTLKVRGTDATFYQVANDNTRTLIRDALDEANLNTIFMDAKVEDGTLAFISDNPVAVQLGVSTRWVSEDAVSDLSELNDLAEIGARFIVGQDEKYAKTFPNQAIEGWWVDIGCADYQNYLIDIIADLAPRVDHINLDFVRFPDTSEVANPVLPCTNPADKVQVVNDLVADLADSAKAANPDVKVSASVFGRVCYGSNIDDGDTVIGQKITLADQVDFVMPMLYPELMDPIYENDPYTGVRDHTECFRRHLPKEKVVPWIQGFGDYADADSILSQISGVEDGDGNGYFVWWMDSIPPDSDTWSLISLEYIEDEVPEITTYGWHDDVSTSVFWVGEDPKPKNNFEGKSTSAYYADWINAYGGVDDPLNRNGYLPGAFIPNENPFYASVPYSDFDEDYARKASASDIPWITPSLEADESLLKNQWIEVRANDISCYAQVEDAGPFVSDDFPYVFDQAAPANTKNENAGLEISPAVHDCLQLQIDLPVGMRETPGAEFPSRTWKTSWRFVHESVVPDGPWKNIISFSDPVFQLPDFVDYPFNLAQVVQIVLSEDSSAGYVVAAAEIAGSLTGDGISNEVKFVSEASLDTSVISIGCNKLSRTILGFETQEQCINYLNTFDSEAVILFRLKNGLPHVVILGKSELGIRMAARVLADYLNYNIVGDTILIDGTSLDDIQVYYPDYESGMKGTLDIFFDMEDNIILDSFDSETLLDVGPQGSNGTIIFEWDFKELEDGEYEAMLSYEGTFESPFRFNVTDGKINITEFDFSIRGLDINDWLISTDSAKGELKFDIGTYGSLNAKMKVLGFDDFTYFQTFEDDIYKGDLEIELTITDLGVPPFEIVKNTFYGTVNYSDGRPMSRGTILGYLSGLYYTQDILEGRYTDFVVKGSPGSKFKAYISGYYNYYVDTLTLRDTDEEIEFNIVIDLPPGHFEDDDQDGIPNDFDKCPDSQSYLVDGIGCDCSQKNCFESICQVNDWGYPTCTQTCNDGYQNQFETGIDCGGPCEPCTECMTADVCLDSQPSYCTAEKNITNNCGKCGCPEGFTCENDGQCYKTIELEPLQCKINNYVYSDSPVNCDYFAGSTALWHDFMRDSYSFDNEQASATLNMLNDRTRELDKLIKTAKFDTAYDKDFFIERHEGMIINELVEKTGLNYDSAEHIFNIYSLYFKERSEWVKETLMPYTHVSVHGMPSFIKDDVKDDIEDELKKVSICIETEETCVLPGTKCPGYTVVEGKKREVQQVIQNEMNHVIRKSIPGIAKFFGLRARISVNLDAFQLNVSSDMKCEPLRVTPDVTCRPLIINGNSDDKADLLFIGDGYYDEDALLKEINNVLDYNGDFADTVFEGLFSREPFKSNKDRFNIWYIESKGSIDYEADNRFQENGFIPSVADTLEIAANCPQADYPVLLSTSAFRSFCFLNGTGPCIVSMFDKEPGRLFAHEFGHGFASLADEYYNFVENKDAENFVEELFELSITGPNCKATQAEAESAWGSLVNGEIGYFNKCGGDCGYACQNYIRPTLQSIMDGPQNFNVDSITTVEQFDECLEYDWSTYNECIGPPYASWYDVNAREIKKALSMYKPGGETVFYEPVGIYTETEESKTAVI